MSHTLSVFLLRELKPLMLFISHHSEDVATTFLRMLKRLVLSLYSRCGKLISEFITDVVLSLPIIIRKFFFLLCA